MADRTKLDSNFISLVLSVSGRVRPIDLHAIPEAERTNALQAFYQENAASMALHFDGADLVQGVGSGTAPAAQSVPVADAQAPEPFVSDYAPATTPAADATAAGLDPAADATADSDFFAIAPDGATNAPDADWSADVPVGEPQFPAEKVSFLWWLLPILFTWLGGLIAFFLLRKKNPKAAKAMLITGIVITVVLALAGVGVAVLGLGLNAVPGLS